MLASIKARGAALLLATLCSISAPTQGQDFEANFDGSVDYHSFANFKEVRVTHLSLDLDVDFADKQLSGDVVFDLDFVDKNAKSLVLDTNMLTINAVSVWRNDQWSKTKYSLAKQVEDLGRALTIALPAGTTKVKVNYSTHPDAGGLQWLEPGQTAGKNQPFLYTQAQPTYARTFVPTQDSPAVRVTYDAVIRTPKTMRAVMSAENDPNAEWDGEFHFKMPQAIPSYLIALGVGDLKFKAMGPDTGVYAEASILDAAAKEFEDTQSMLDKVELKLGDYAWGRYDLLILPPSFPWGGMENPRLSFITPTVIAGDKSLVALIAHELAHSWSGNTVTNATWRDIWLNEGFTTYLTHRIMEDVYGERRDGMERVLAYQDLQTALESKPLADQRLAPDLRGRHPDDGFSAVPYDKGALFVTELEQRVGRDQFDVWLKGYFDHFAFQSLTTETFLQYIEKTLVNTYPDKVSMARIKSWIEKPGIPAGAPVPTSNAFDLVAEAQKEFLSSGSLAKVDADNYTIHEWLYFLNTMPKQLSNEQLVALDKAYGFTQTTNNEVAHSWLRICIRNGYAAADDRLEDYLTSIGRRKLIVPLYADLVANNKLERAKAIYAKAKPIYHQVARGTIEGVLGAN